MLSLRSIVGVVGLVGLYLAVPACSTGEEVATAVESELETLDTASVVGAIDFGVTSAPVAHSGAPRYRALRFGANAGDSLDVWVRSTNGDAVAWITNARFKSLATNDDASSSTHDAHVVTTAVESGTHYVVFRERDLEAATFTVSLSPRASVPACTGACVPGTLDFTSAGCTSPDTYRVRQCTSTCNFGAFTASCGAPPSAIDIAGVRGAVSSTVAVLGGQLQRLGGNSCPITTAFGVDATAFSYTQIHNPLPRGADLIVYNSVAPGGAVADTALAVYAGDEAPATVEERRMCLRASSTGNSSLTGDARFASIDGPARKIYLPAGATFTVYTTAERAGVSGPVRLNVRTESIDP